VKRSSACPLQADESRLPHEGCSFSQVEKVGLRVSREKAKVRCNARPHPAPLLQERENRPPQSLNFNEWTYPTRIVTTGGGGKPFLLLGEKARMRASGEKAGWQAPANRPRKSLISTIVSLIFTSLDAWERDQPAKRVALMLFRPLGRCGVRLAPRSGRNGKCRHVVGETPTTATGTTALPTAPILNAA
jgi:hypothetical protein